MTRKQQQRERGQPPNLSYFLPLPCDVIYTQQQQSESIRVTHDSDFILFIVTIARREYNERSIQSHLVVLCPFFPYNPNKSEIGEPKNDEFFKNEMLIL